MSTMADTLREAHGKAAIAVGAISLALEKRSVTRQHLVLIERNLREAADQTKRLISDDSGEG